MTTARGALLDELERRIGHRFADRQRLIRALTHGSAAADAGKGPLTSYQRLEFLGDRVLALVVADMLIEAFPKANEGELARRLTALVRNDTCAAVARDLDLGAVLKLGGGERTSGGAAKAAILGDACEALIAALYLDGGLDVARRFIEAHWTERMLDRSALQRDAKTTLQEWAQGRGLPAPAYAIAERTGPEHQPRFKVRVTLPGMAEVVGEGGSRREAEQSAATGLLLREGIWKAEAPHGR